MNTYNILFVAPEIFYPYHGGVARITDKLCKEYKAYGHKCFYLSFCNIQDLPSYDYPAETFTPPNLHILNAPENIEFYQDLIKKYNIQIVINQFAIANAMVELLSQTGNSTTKVISVIRNSPTGHYKYLWQEFVQLRNDDFIQKFKRLARIIVYIRYKHREKKRISNEYAYKIKHSDAIVLLSNLYFEDLNPFCNTQANFFAIPNCNIFESKECNLQSKKKQILFVGRLDTIQKRADRLVKVWKLIYKKHPDWEVIIIGDGPEKSNIEQMIESRNLERIRMIGSVQSDSYYREASILCMTSNFEGWPNVITEAMQNKVVPVAYNSFAAINDTIKEYETGLLVPPYSISKMAAKLSWLMDHTIQREQMAENGYVHIKQYSAKYIIPKWNQLFDKLIQTTKSK